MPLNKVQPVTVLVLALAMSACASTDGALPVPGTGGMSAAEATAPVAPANELAPQNLQPGECGTFFWTADSEHRFVAFENETRGYAQLFVDGGTESFSGQRRDGLHVAGDHYRRGFSDPARNLDIEIEGRIGDPLPTGQRIERVVMRVQQSDGALFVVPLIGHYACR